MNAPRLRTDIDLVDFAATYRRFADIIGEKAWMHRVAQMKAEVKHNRFLNAFLREENNIAFGLDQCTSLVKRYGGLPNVDGHHELYPAIGFATQVLSMMDLAGPIEAERLSKRVAGALKNPHHMRALRLELAVATHFVRRGHTLQWPEMVGSGTFDLLVTDLGENGLELECKSISDDKGHSIHRREALDFHHLMHKELEGIRKSLKIGLAIVVTVPNRLPTKHADRQALAKCIKQQITIGVSARLNDGIDIRIAEFGLERLSRLSDNSSIDEVRQIIENVTSTKNREGALIGTHAGGAIAFVIQSAIDDDLMDSTFKTLSEAAKEQLSGSRPGLLIAGFDGLGADQLRSVAQQDSDGNQQPTALRVKASRFLAANHRDHVVAVGFLSRGGINTSTRGTVDTGGVAYYFPKRESPYWHNDFEGLFGARNN